MSKNPITIEGDLAYVTLTQGKEAVIDRGDVAVIEGYRWQAMRSRRCFYAGTTVPAPTPCGYSTLTMPSPVDPLAFGLSSSTRIAPTATVVPGHSAVLGKLRLTLPAQPAPLGRSLTTPHAQQLGPAQGFFEALRTHGAARTDGHRCG